MTDPRPNDSHAPRLRRREVLSLSRLDRLLDVPDEQFDARVAELVAEMKSRSVRVAVPGCLACEAGRTPERTVGWVRLYDHQVGRLPRPDRADELRMARRYAFLRARAVAALGALGLDEERCDGILRRGMAGLREAGGRGRRSARRHAERCLAEFEALRNLCVEASLYLVLSCVQRYRSLGVDVGDLVQEGNASLFQALEGFDWRRGVRFKTYAQYWIHQAILKVLYNSSRTVRVPVWVQKALRKIERVRERGRQQGQEPTSEAVGRELDIPAERVEELLATRRRAISLDAEVAGGDNGTSLAQLLPDEHAPPIFDDIDDGNLRERLDEVMADLPGRERMILVRRYGLHGSDPETLGEIAADLGVTAERVRQLQKAALGRLQKPSKMQRLVAYN